MSLHLLVSIKKNNEIQGNCLFYYSTVPKKALYLIKDIIKNFNSHLSLIENNEIEKLIIRMFQIEDEKASIYKGIPKILSGTEFFLDMMECKFSYYGNGDHSSAMCTGKIALTRKDMDENKKGIKNDVLIDLDENKITINGLFKAYKSDDFCEFKEIKEEELLALKLPCCPEELNNLLCFNFNQIEDALDFLDESSGNWKDYASPNIIWTAKE